MKGLILCAGMGMRLRPLTLELPKCMISVGGKPVLHILVDYLNSYGIREIVVNLHYLPEKVYKYFGTKLLYFYEPQPLGEEATIEALQPWFGKEPYVVLNGDTVTNLDLTQIIDKDYNCVRSMDGEVYTGQMFCNKGYPVNKKKLLEVQTGCYWQDIGTPAGLEKARLDYEEKFYRLS